MLSWHKEEEFCRRHKLQATDLVAGIDEVGRGCLAGPVVAYAVAFKERNLPFVDEIKDSKKLTPKARIRVAQKIKEHCFYGRGESSVKEIDTINILQASLVAMQRAFHNLIMRCNSTYKVTIYSIKGVLVDGNKAPNLPVPCYTVVKGDNISYSIAAASILSKVDRDFMMQKLSVANNHIYDWDSNKGYGTKKHQEALKTYGVTEHHRLSFAPVRAIVQNSRKTLAP